VPRNNRRGSTSEVLPADGTICLVTIHGIGFQRAPDDHGSDGYADLLHEHLNGALGAESVQPGRSGKRIAHIALVHAHPENRAFQHIGAALETLAKSVASALNYGMPWDIAQMLVADIRLAGGNGAPAPISLQPRDRDQFAQPGHDHRVTTSGSTASIGTSSLATRSAHANGARGSDADPRSLEQGLFQVIDDAGLHTPCAIDPVRTRSPFTHAARCPRGLLEVVRGQVSPRCALRRSESPAGRSRRAAAFLA
jgi:hypothetical protein